MRRDNLTETEIRLTRLINYGVFALITIPLANVPALGLAAAAMLRDA